MATGEIVLRVLDILAGGHPWAEHGSINGGSIPAEAVKTVRLDPGNTQYVDLLCLLDGYAGGGLTFRIPWLSRIANTSSVRLEVGIRRLAAGERLENAHTYDFRGAAYAAPATAGNLALAEGTLTDGAQIDNWANGELAIVRIRRVPGDTSDRMLGHVDVIPFGIYAVEA